jgi:hypothetical protein
MVKHYNQKNAYTAPIISVFTKKICIFNPKYVMVVGFLDRLTLPLMRLEKIASDDKIRKSLQSRNGMLRIFDFLYKRIYICKELYKIFT